MEVSGYRDHHCPHHHAQSHCIQKREGESQFTVQLSIEIQYDDAHSSNAHYPDIATEIQYDDTNYTADISVS